MSSTEYRQLKEQMDRIERMLQQMNGCAPADVCSVPVEPPPEVTPEMSESARVRAVQAEGSYILQTQGIDAYKEFWKQQGKKRKPRLKHAA